MSIGIITNPNSRKNRHRRHRCEELGQVVGPQGVVRQTAKLEEIEPALREFVRKGIEYWVSDGGDGTLHWMLNEGWRVLGEPEHAAQRLRLPAAVPTNGGTIDFVAKKAGLRGDALSILGRLAERVKAGERPPEVELDTIQLRMRQNQADGAVRETRRLGFAAALGGLSQRFFHYYYADRNPTNLTILKVVAKTFRSMPFAFTPLGQLPALPRDWLEPAVDIFRPVRAKVEVDGQTLPWREHTGIHAAGIDINLGNVLRFFPLAEREGRMQFLVGRAAVWEVVRSIPNMVVGKPLRARELYDRTGERMRVEAEGGDVLEPVIDGELYPGVQWVEITKGPKVRIPRLGAHTAGIPS